MKGRSASKIKLTSYDELLGGGEEINDIQQVSLEHLHSFENHPFQVNDDEAMEQLRIAEELLQEVAEIGRAHGISLGQMTNILKLFYEE